jgi:hypothetical protein
LYPARTTYPTPYGGYQWIPVDTQGDRTETLIIDLSGVPVSTTLIVERIMHEGAKRGARPE